MQRLNTAKILGITLNNDCVNNCICEEQESNKCNTQREATKEISVNHIVSAVKKTCTLCGVSSEIHAFNKNKKQKDGHSTVCKVCARQQQRRRYENNPELHRRNNRNCKNEGYLQGRCRNCKKERLPNLRFCEFHYIVERCWHSLGKCDKETAKIIHQKLIDQSYQCAYSGEKLVLGVNAEMDHIFPVSRFPELRSDTNNIEWVSRQVNHAKNNMTKDEFLAFCKSCASRGSSH